MSKTGLRVAVVGGGTRPGTRWRRPGGPLVTLLDDPLPASADPGGAFCRTAGAAVTRPGFARLQVRCGRFRTSWTTCWRSAAPRCRRPPTSAIPGRATGPGRPDRAAHDTRLGPAPGRLARPASRSGPASPSRACGRSPGIRAAAAGCTRTRVLDADLVVVAGTALATRLAGRHRCRHPRGGGRERLDVLHPLVPLPGGPSLCGTPLGGTSAT
jgi:hypothetical protein